MAGSRVQAILIHAVYLINCASEDAEIRAKSLESLKIGLRTGAMVGMLTVGLGLLGEWAGRFRLPTSLLIPFGFALLVLWPLGLLFHVAARGR